MTGSKEEVNESEEEITEELVEEVKEILEDMGSTVNEMEKKAIGKKKKHAFWGSITSNITQFHELFVTRTVRVEPGRKWSGAGPSLNYLYMSRFP